MHTFPGFCKLWASPCPQMLLMQSLILVCQPNFTKVSSNLTLLPSRLTPPMNTTALCTPPTAKTNWKNLMPTRLSLNTSIILYVCPWPKASSSILQASGPCPKFMKLYSYSSSLQNKSPCTCSIQMTSVTWEHPEGTNGLPSEPVPLRILWGHHLPCVYRWEQPHTQAGMHNPLYRTRVPTGSGVHNCKHVLKDL